MNAKITQGKRQLWQWDTGVQLMLFDIGTANEVHFATPDGVIRRDIVNNMCNIPDVVLQRAGTMICYVFNREPYEGDTRHEFHFDVLPRPKPADYIDPPEEADNLDQLAERVASIIGPGSGGGTSAPEIMKITFTSPDGGDTIVPDKTFSEMAEAISAGKLLYAEIAAGIDATDGQYQLYQAADGAILFARIGVIPGDTPLLALLMVGVTSSNEVVSEIVPISGESGVAIVNITENDNGDWTADKSAAELYDAFSAGAPVYVNFNDVMFAPAQLVTPDQVVFRIVMPDGTVMAVVDYEGAVTVEITPGGGDDGGEVIVDVTRAGDVYTTSMQADAIYTAHAAGKRIVCRADLPKVTGMLLQPTYISDVLVVFTGAFTDDLFASNGSMVVSVAIPNSNTAQVTINTLDKLPNPEPLTINGTSYDGSEAVNIDIAAGGGDNKFTNIYINNDISNVTKATLRTDNNGQSLALSAAVVEMNVPASDGASWVTFTFLNDRERTLSVTINQGVNTTASYYRACCFVYHGKAIVWCTSPVAGYSEQPISTIHPPYIQNFIDINKITGVEISAGKKFPASTRCSFLGVNI